MTRSRGINPGLIGREEKIGGVFLHPGEGIGRNSFLGGLSQRRRPGKWRREIFAVEQGNKSVPA